MIPPQRISVSKTYYYLLVFLKNCGLQQGPSCGDSFLGKKQGQLGYVDMISKTSTSRSRIAVVRGSVVHYPSLHTPVVRGCVAHLPMERRSLIYGPIERRSPIYGPIMHRPVVHSLVTVNIIERRITDIDLRSIVEHGGRPLV